MRVITVVNLKGGSAKTTSAVFLACEWASQGRTVLLVDADPQGTALRWSEQADPWDVPTLSLPVRDLHKRLSGITGDRYDVVLIDTPPLDEKAGIVYSALRAADTVLVTMAPTMSELDRLHDVWAAIEEVTPLRAGPPLEVAVLLNRVVPNAASTGEIRRHIADGGHHVLNTTIPRREAFAQAFGGPVPTGGPYAAAAAELDRIGAVA